jgi:Mg-chelatase subunit ChlD
MKIHRLWHVTYICLIFILLLITNTKNSLAQENTSQRSILLLIDASGSMMGAKMDSVKSAAKQIIKMLLPCNTEFAIMGFTGKKEDPIPYRLDFTTNPTDLFTFIDNLKPWGGTLIGAALKTSSLYFTAHKKTSKATKQSIILLSDGQSDDNVTLALKELKERDALIQTECIGYDLLKDKTAVEQLQQIVTATGGEYYSATAVSNVIKAFYKSSIKTIIRDVPVVVRKYQKSLKFSLPVGDIHKMLTTQNWFLDSIQINVSDSLYEMAQFITQESMQDTMPKSLVFDDPRRVSLFIDKGAGPDALKKWVEGNFTFFKNTLTITILNYYFKLQVKAIHNRSLVLCVNKFKFVTENTNEPKDEICDCSNKITNDNPYILVYFSKAGCY